MEIKIGNTLAELRKAKKFMQKDVAAKLSTYGIKVSSKTIYNWEKELALPNAKQFVALCAILGVNDVLWEFAAINKGTFAGLNQNGRDKAQDYIKLLHKSNEFNYDVIEEDEYHNGAVSELRRSYMRLYDLPAAAGTGNYLDSDSYTEIEIDKSVPKNADFAVRVSGDSMEPRFMDGQIVFVKEQSVVQVGDIGVFALDGDSYIKKLGHGEFISLNPNYSPIPIKEHNSVHTFGKVVGG